MKKNAIVVLFVCVVLTSLSFSSFEWFRVDFPWLMLIYKPSLNTLTIWQLCSGPYPNLLLSQGHDWSVLQIKPYLYHLKMNTWSGFFWSVNTSRREAYRVTGSAFGSLGGNLTPLNLSAFYVPEGTGDGIPEEFNLSFKDGYLIYTKSSQSIQISAAGAVLSYGHDWQKIEVYPHLIHFKHISWGASIAAGSEYFWKVNTSRKEFYFQHKGTFGGIGGREIYRPSMPVTVYGQ